jgi:hypothetical protein
MSIQMEIRDKEALKAACERLGFSILVGNNFRLHSTNELGIGVQLPRWKYPIVIRLNGSVAYDNYNGSWGNIDELNKLVAYYGLEKAKMEAQKQGYSTMESFNEQTQELELEIEIGV